MSNGRFVTLKEYGALKLEGVTIDLDVVDGSIKSATFTDASGSTIRVAKSGTYEESIKFLVPEPPKVIDVYTVTHKIGSQEYKKTFTERNEAESFHHELCGIHGIECEIVEGKAEVPAGKEVAEDSDLIPF